jgi:hypothetical protein
MRRFLQIFGIIALIAVAALAGGIGTLIYSGQKLDFESKEFVDSAVPAISRDWDKQELLKRISPDFMRATDADQLDRYFSVFSTLGHLIKYEGSTGDSNMNFTTNAGSRITASYTARVRFENGEAAIRLELVKAEGRWLINSLNVTPIGPVRASTAHA